MSFEFSVVPGKAVHEILFESLEGCMSVVARAYQAHRQGQSINPNSFFLRFPAQPRNRIIALPAWLGGDFGVSGIKWIASYPENVGRGFPRASAVLILNHEDTGYPYACLEGSIISAARTAASAVLAARAARPDARMQTVGIVGTGLIARYLYLFLLASGWDIDSLILFDACRDEAERFAKLSIDPERHRCVRIADDVDDAIRASDLVCFATTASKPYVDDARLFSHNPLVLNISLRDLAPEILLESFNVVDDVEHVLNADTSPHLAFQRVGHRRFITATIAELLLGERELDTSRPTIISPFGLGVLDLAVGQWVFEVARQRGRAVRVDDFFFELTR